MVTLPSELFEEIKKGNCVPFIGAGLSIGAGLPNWKDLIHPLAQELGLTKETDNLRIAQYYENEYGRNRLIRAIREKIGAENSPTQAHLYLASLPFQTIITTNYDTLIEQALRIKRKQFSVVSRNIDTAYWSEDTVQVVKLHGSIEDPSSLVITANDYLNYFRKNPLFSDVLKVFSTTKTLLFIGYSLQDSNFQQIISEIEDQARGHIRPSYCVLPEFDEYDSKDWKKRNVNFIQSEAEPFLQQLGESIKSPIIEPPPDILESFEKHYSTDSKLCFVLMPFRQELDEIYQEIIKPVVEDHGLRCLRADEIYDTGPIMDDIWEHIQKAGIIIAELTGRNPNVFYELGISHATKKRTILLTQSIEDIPFDLRHRRCIVYTNTIRGAISLKEQLINTIKVLSG